MKTPVFLMLFCLFFMHEMSVFAQNPEINMLRRINSDSSKFADHTFKFFSKAVLPVSIATPATMLAFGFVNNNDIDKRNGYKSAISILTAGLLCTSLKLIVKRPRPFKTYDFIRAKDKVGPFSFPSGHTTFAFAAATSLSLAYPKWFVVAPAYLFAGLAAYSRMYLGVHFPLDVFGGLVIGVGSSILVWEVDRLMNKK